MNYKLISTVVSCAIALNCHTIWASASSQGPAQTPPRNIVFRLSDLRSAYLIRDGVVHYNTNSNSPESIRAQVQRHFNVVLGLLLVSTPQSIETALTRLEESSEHKWTSAERSALRQRLLEMRYMQLRRLAAYRDRGRIPLNEAQSPRPVPIFVDEHDTACAVGHLMRESGLKAEVDDIHAVNNGIYVPDLSTGAVAQWILTSGLTMEEAALIQPGYSGPSPTNLLGEVLPQNAFIDFNGLRFSRFSFKRENGQYVPAGIEDDTAPLFCSLNPNSCQGSLTNPIEVSTPDPNLIGLSYQTGTFSVPHTIIKIVPHGTQWLFVGASPGINDPNPVNRLGMTSTLSTDQRVTLQFRVDTLSAGTSLNQFVLGMSEFVGGYSLPNRGRIDVDLYPRAVTDPDTGAFVPIDKFGSVHMRPSNTTQDSGLFKIDSLSFVERQSVWVQVKAYVTDGGSLDGFVLHFNVVPEPLSSLLFISGFVALLTFTRRRAVSIRMRLR